MRNTLAGIRDGLRATLLLRPRGTASTQRATLFLGATLAYLAVSIATSWLDTDAPRTFLPYGIVTTLADALVTLAAAWVLVRVARRESLLVGVAGITLVATIGTSLFVHWPLGHATSWLYANDHVAGAIIAELLSRAWWLFVLFTLARWLLGRGVGRALAAALLAYAVSAAVWWWLPGAPMFVETPGGRSGSNVGSDVVARTGFDGEAAEEGPAFDPEYVMYDQPRLLEEAIAALAPRTAGRANLYVVTFAGDGSENVFRNESEYVERLFGTRFGAAGHTIVLQNSPATVRTRPLATLTNLRWTLESLAGAMDPAEDILFVYLTSHGSADHELHVGLGPLALNPVSPDDLADALRTVPAIRWKVVVVNACYSGGFVDALRDDSTLVIAAARPDRTSFGCGSASDITFFGKAFLAEALNTTTSFTEAFARARESVATWEAEAKLEPPSEPQIATTTSIEGKLERWRRTLPEAPAVPFAPASDTPDDAGLPPADSDDSEP